MNDEERAKAGELALRLVDSFGWAGTPQGYGYWWSVWSNLCKLAQKEDRP